VLSHALGALRPAVLRGSRQILQGYTRLLRVLGSNLAEFLQNLNDLHLHLQYCWPDMLAPACRCEQVRVRAACVCCVRVLRACVCVCVCVCV
jgi:hypothetical protein